MSGKITGNTTGNGTPRDGNAVETGNPFPGPRPFEPLEAKYFFGREREKLELVSMILANRVVFLYAQSGAGKTSLLNACLLPALRDEQDFDVLPNVRLGTPLPQGISADSVKNIFSFNALRAWKKDADPRSFLSQSIGDFLFDDLVGKIAGLGENESRPAPRLIVLDQFEEIFTTYPERWKDRKAFFLELASALDPDPDEWRSKLKSAGLSRQRDEPDRSLRILFVLREDYLANLHSYADLLPIRPAVRVRMERLRKEAACEAIEKPAELVGKPFVEGVAYELVEKLLENRIKTPGGKLVRVEGEFVEPVQLQIICKNLIESVGEKHKVDFSDLQRLGDVNEPLAKYYESAIKSAAALTSEREAVLRDWFEHSLITPAGTRGTVFMDESSQTAAGLQGKAVTLFQAAYLICGDARAGGQWYELTHDRFIEPILQSNKRWRDAHTDQTRRELESKAVGWSSSGAGKNGLLNEEELKVAENWLTTPKTAELGHSRTLVDYIKTSRLEIDSDRLEYKTRTAPRLRRLVAALAVLFLIASVAGVYAQIQRSAAQEAYKDTKKALELLDTVNKELEKQKTRAESKAKEATLAKEETEGKNEELIAAIADAEKQRGIAESERAKAEDQKLLAQAAEQKATAAAISAEGRRLEAEVARALAVKKGREADAARALADQRKVEADELRARAEKLSRESDARALAARSLSERTDPLESDDPRDRVDLSLQAIKKTEGDNKVVKEAIDSLTTTLPGALLERRPLGYANKLAAASFNKNGSSLTTIGYGDLIALGNGVNFSLANGYWAPLKVQLSGHVGNLILSPDGSTLAYSTSDENKNSSNGSHQSKGESQIFKNIKLVNMETGETAITHGRRRGVFKLAFNENAEYLATSDMLGNYGVLKVDTSGKSKKVWNKPSLLEKTRVRIFGERLRLANTFAFSNVKDSSKDDQILLATGFQDGEVIVNDVKTGREYARLPVYTQGGESKSIVAMAFDPDKKFLVTSSRDKSLKLWDLSTTPGKDGKRVLSEIDDLSKPIDEMLTLFQTYHKNPVTSIAFSKDGSIMATGSEDRTVILWKKGNKGQRSIPDKFDWALLPVVRLPDHTNQIIGLSFSPDGKRLATLAADDKTRIWNISSLGDFLKLRARIPWIEGKPGDIDDARKMGIPELVEDIRRFLPRDKSKDPE